jgi:hypothetical protein
LKRSFVPTLQTESLFLFIASTFETSNFSKYWYFQSKKRNDVKRLPELRPNRKFFLSMHEVLEYVK